MTWGLLKPIDAKEIVKNAPDEPIRTYLSNNYYLLAQINKIINIVKIIFLICALHINALCNEKS